MLPPVRGGIKQCCDSSVRLSVCLSVCLSYVSNSNGALSGRVFLKKNYNCVKFPFPSQFPFPPFLSLLPPPFSLLPYLFLPSFSLSLFYFPVFTLCPFLSPFPLPLLFPLPFLSPISSPEVWGSAVSFPRGARGVASHCWILQPPLPFFSTISSPEVWGSAVSSPSGVRGVASHCWILQLHKCAAGPARIRTATAHFVPNSTLGQTLFMTTVSGVGLH